ncbi:hypothetical protein EDD85DRAFT_942907 [Armillaria nabsnona]|nr:hypothetical protein EDD85DRAFT_942907 [Armillaria nabsnona]
MIVEKDAEVRETQVFDECDSSDTGAQCANEVVWRKERERGCITGNETQYRLRRANSGWEGGILQHTEYTNPAIPGLPKGKTTEYIKSSWHHRCGRSYHPDQDMEGIDRFVTLSSPPTPWAAAPPPLPQFDSPPLIRYRVRRPCTCLRPVSGCAVLKSAQERNMQEVLDELLVVCMDRSLVYCRSPINPFHDRMGSCRGMIN